MIVIIESPYAGDVVKNIQYGFECVRDSLSRGESPFASHLFYTLALNDKIPQERERGIHAGFEFRSKADKTVVYTDLGISPEMQAGIDHARILRQTIEYRSCPNWRENENSAIASPAQVDKETTSQLERDW